MALSTADQVQELYIAYYGRPADPEGLAYWTSEADRLGGVTGIVNAFGVSPEATALHEGMSTEQLVNSLYQQLFGRDADVEGLQYWSGEINSGVMTLQKLAYSMILGAQGADITAIENKLAAADAFTAAINTTQEYIAYGHDGSAPLDTGRAWLATVNSDPASVTSAEATIDSTLSSIVESGSQTGQTFTLTTGQDIILGTSNNDKIIGIFGAATGNTLTAGDSIDGNAGNNVLDLAAAGNAMPSPAVAVSNVQTINVSDTVGATLDAVLFTGDPAINFSNTLAGKTSTLDNAAVGSTVGLAGVGNLTVDYMNATGSADNAKISLAGVGTSATATSTIDVASSNTIEAVTIATTGTNFATLNAGTAAGTITMTGDGTNTMTIGSDKTTATIDASQTTGTNTINLGTGLSNGDVVKGGTGADTVTFTAAAALGTVTFTDVETVTGGFGATGAALNLGTSTNINTLNITDATVAMSITNASIGAINFGKAGATADVEVGTIDLKGATATAINSVNGATFGVNIDTVEATHSPDVNLTFNTGVSGNLYVADVYTAKSLGDVTMNVGEGGSGELNWVSAGVGSKGDIGNIALNVGLDGSGYIDSAAYSGSVGDVTVLVNENGSGYVYASADAYSGTGINNYGGGGNVGNISITASGDYADAGAGISAGSGNIGNVTILANGQAAVASGYFSAYEWDDAASGDAGQTGSVGNIDIQAIGDGAYASGYFDLSGGMGDVNFVVNGADADGDLTVYGYSGNAGIINMSTTGFASYGSAYVSAGGSVGDVTMSVNGGSASAYYEVSAGGYSGGNVGTVSFDVTGTEASGVAYIDSMSGALGDGSIGNVIFNAADNVSAGYMGIYASGSLGTASITVGNNVGSAYYSADAYAGDTGAVTAVIGHDSNFSGYVSAGADVGSITVSTGNNSNIYLDVSGANANDITVTSATTSTGAYADVYVDADMLSSVNLGGFAGSYYIDAASVTGATVLIGGANGGTILGGAGADVITGGAKADTLTGNAGADLIAGGAGADIIDGGAGNDMIAGGAGADALTGGADADTFVYTTLSDTGITLATSDTIADFISGTDFIKTGTAGSLTNYVEAAVAADFTSALAAATLAMDGTVKYYLTDTVADGGLLFVDATMDGTADAVIKLTGITSANFASSDIIA